MYRKIHSETVIKFKNTADLRGWFNYIKCLVYYLLIPGIIIISIQNHAVSQIVIESGTQQKIEEISETTGTDFDLSDLADELVHLKEHPINLNQTSAEELRKIPYLNDKLINNFLTYKKSYGDIFSIFELQAIEGFDSGTIHKIIPYIRVGQGPEKHPIRLYNLLTESHIQLILRCQQILQKRQGYNVPDSVIKLHPEAGYPGSPQKYFFRFTYNYFDRVSMGLAGEKDPGEQFFRGNQPNGMDFYAGYLRLQNTGALKNLIIGNFQVDFGQGLTLCSGLSFGSLISSGNSLRYARGISPSLGMNENAYLRGVASTIRIADMEISAFYSNHKRDANITLKDANGRVIDVSSFQETGYHRTPTELADRNALREVIFGGHVNYRNRYLKIGLTGFRSQWSARISPKQYPYNQFQFRGKENLNIGIDFQFLFKTNYLFGELSRSQNGGLAYLAGLLASPDPRFSFSVIYRNYHRKYQNFLSNSLGQNSESNNEKGILVSFYSQLFKGAAISAYMDHFIFPWLKYRTGQVSRGTEYGLQADYKAGSKVIMFARFRAKTWQINESYTGQHETSLIDCKSVLFRYQLDWQVNQAILLKSRFDLVRNTSEEKGNRSGYLIFQDIYFKPGKIPVSVSFRYALFDTDSYDERLYTYEPDMMYAYSSSTYDGQGIRCLFLFTWSPWRKLACGFRYAQTFYTDRNSINDGPDKISGNSSSELKIQLTLKL